MMQTKTEREHLLQILNIPIHPHLDVDPLEAVADFLLDNGVKIPVLCKECKHFGGHGACHCHAADENGTPIFVREDDFCSYGERRTDG